MSSDTAGPCQAWPTGDQPGAGTTGFVPPGSGTPSPRPPTDGGRRLLKKAGRTLWHAVVLGLVLFLAWRFIDFEEFLSALAAISWPWLILLLGLATADRFLMAGKWLQLLRYVKSTATFPAVLSSYYQVAFVQRFVPSSLSGDALRAILISRQFQGTSGVLASMVVEKLVAILAAIFLALCGFALVVVNRFDAQHGWLFALLPALLLTTLAGLRCSFHRPLAERLLRLTPARVRPALARVYDQYAGFRKAPRMLALHFAYCVVEQVVQLLLWLVAALALGVDVPVLTLFAALSVAQCLRKFAIILEGWLFGEFTMVLVCSLFGIPQAQALAFSLLAHASAVLAALPGAVLSSRSAVRITDLRGAGRKGPEKTSADYCIVANS